LEEWLWKNLGFGIFPLVKVVIALAISGGGVICRRRMALVPLAGQEDIEVKVCLA